MIIDSVTRVVREETGIHVKKVVAPLTPFTYTTEKRPGPGDTIRENAFHLSYLVNVKEKGDDFVVNPNEHSEGLWVKVDELDSVPMTDEMRKLVTEAFETSW
jgi:8-oxo-dGTP pyrophosphatase MutT (NUDIX family)